jgi:2-polyprenyl-3-methyl-5-hydroxy-6-metoxy-1,4-benzoquinol methylase
MAFDYDANTRRHYQSDEIAEEYHAAYTQRRGWRSLAHRVVAAREVATVAVLANAVAHQTVLDVPCGTGKLAPVFSRLRSSVIAGDISAQMLRFARDEYEKAGVASAEFRVVDATQLTAIGRFFDLAVCLRLLHRVPGEVKDAILDELAAVSTHTIVSFGVESRYHKTRRRLRAALFGGGVDPLCFESLSTIRTRMKRRFSVLDERWVFRGVSQEIVFLAKRKGT